MTLSSTELTMNQAEESLHMDEIRLLLASKRTSLATLRTGIAVFAVPLSIVTALIATSQFYDVMAMLPLLVPVLTLSAFLVGVGVYLVSHAVLRIRRYNKKVLEIEDRDALVRELVEEP
ncbi:MAG: hypothetical protein ACE5HJ_03430 [Thermoplasmata archaeon]